MVIENSAGKHQLRRKSVKIRSLMVVPRYGAIGPGYQSTAVAARNIEGMPWFDRNVTSRLGVLIAYRYFASDDKPVNQARTLVTRNMGPRC